MNFAAVLAVEAFATDAAATTGRGVPPEIVTGVGFEVNPLATTRSVADPSSSLCPSLVSIRNSENDFSRIA